MKPYTAIIGVFFVIVILISLGRCQERKVTPIITETAMDSIVDNSTIFEVINEIKKGDITLNTLEIEGHDYLLVSKNGFTAITHSETCKCWKDYNSL